MAKKDLKPYPFHDGAVNENAAVRVIRMVKPECPADPRPELILRNGDTVPNPRYTGEPSCQEQYKRNNSGVWDVEKCIALGHDPYHTTFRKTIVEDVVDERETIKDNEGNDIPNPDYGYVIDKRTRVKVDKRLNVIQVTDNIRHTSKTEVQLAVAKGCKFMEDFGFSAPCEFRNCSLPWKIDTRWGRYCGERHARLIGADARQVFLIVGGDPYTEDKAAQLREEQLDGIPISKG